MAEGLSPVLTDLPPVIVLCVQACELIRFKRVGVETRHLYPAAYKDPPFMCCWFVELHLPAVYPGLSVWPLRVSKHTWLYVLAAESMHPAALTFDLLFQGGKCRYIFTSILRFVSVSEFCQINISYHFISLQFFFR